MYVVMYVVLYVVMIVVMVQSSLLLFHCTSALRLYDDSDLSHIRFRWTARVIRGNESLTLHHPPVLQIPVVVVVVGISTMEKREKEKERVRGEREEREKERRVEYVMTPHLP